MSSIGPKSDSGLTGLKIRCQQGGISFWRLHERVCFLAFFQLQKPTLIYWLMTAFSVQSQPRQSESAPHSITLNCSLSSFTDLCDYSRFTHILQQDLSILRSDDQQPNSPLPNEVLYSQFPRIRTRTSLGKLFLPLIGTNASLGFMFFLCRQ